VTTVSPAPTTTPRHRVPRAPGTVRAVRLLRAYPHTAIYLSSTTVITVGMAVIETVSR